VGGGFLLSQSISQAKAKPGKERRVGLRVFSLEGLFLFGLLFLGLGLRMINLTDPQLDFHPTRQLRSAIIARGMYYQNLPAADPQLRQAAMQIRATMEVYEPPILEQLVATTYRLLGAEQLWVARVYSSLFWLIGGVALYALVRRIFSAGAGLCSLAFYLVLPWGVTASRAFQPDPWMVMWILVAAYLLYRWMETDLGSWRWTILAGLSAGLAILVKAYAVYPVGGMAMGVFLAVLFKREPGFLKRLLSFLLKPQLWVFALLTVLPPAVYYLGLGDRSTSFASFWIFSFTGMLLEHKFYIRWLGLIRGLLDVMVFFAALLGAFVFPSRARAQVLGLWIGYFLIGATFPFQIYTHDYYSLVLVPIGAISLAPYFDLILSQVRRQPWLWRVVFYIAMLAVGGYYAWVARSQIVAQNFRTEPIPWQIMGSALPQNGAIIGLTHDYGNRLKYYGWRAVQRIWPSEGDFDLSEAAGTEKISDFESYFQDQTAGMDYFLVTLFSDLEAQPALKAMLYDHYPVAMRGDGYILFDLRHPIQ
jgi:hypothetical protein